MSQRLCVRTSEKTYILKASIKKNYLKKREKRRSGNTHVLETSIEGLQLRFGEFG